MSIVLQPRRFGVILLTGLGLSIFASELSATSRTFPYQAEVKASELEVRSGPGQRYYVTGRLSRGQMVTVHRHDPGGWFMIAPPPGSFSWIEADLVQRQGPQHGVVSLRRDANGNPRRAIVRIGSEFSDDHAFYGRELHQGDTVEILGEKSLQTKYGPVRMYRITPPALEYRWVKGDYIVPVSEKNRREQDLDPFSVPASAIEQTSDRLTESNIPSDPFAVPSVPDKQTAISQARTRLAEIDQRYLAMIKQPPEQWQLDSLADEYRSLQLEAEPIIASKIAERLKAISTRQQILNDYLSVTRTGQKVSEHQAAKLISGHGGQLADNQFAPVPTQPQQTGTTTPTPSTPPGQLSGAGLLRPVVGIHHAGITHAIMDKQGKILALLRLAPGTNLQLRPMIGQAVGIIGERHHDRQLGRDVIDVRQIVRVALAP